MAGAILVVKDRGLHPSDPALDSRWEQITWEMFLERPAGFHPALAILVLPAGDRASQLLRQVTGCATHTLAILDRNALPDTIDLAFAVADDVILWPERDIVVQQRIRRLADPDTAEIDAAYENLIAELAQVNLVGRDPMFLRLAERIPTCARADLPVLITGETGTGKELFARAVHFLSRRRNQPFVPVDCGSIPDHLFENEMFGHARGAYTDARSDHKGLAGMAESGTLFLDEIDSLSLAAQAKLLRFLQERQFKPLGAERYASSDVKLVAATNGSLEELVKERRFRQDLYFRLNVLRLDLPALRERPEDIVPLAEHFLTLHAVPGERRRFTPAALRKLRAHSWPGNVRELINEVQRAVAFARGSSIAAEDLTLLVQPDVTNQFRQAREETLRSFERDYVAEMLRQSGGNVTRAARAAGKERRAFGRLVKKHGLSASGGSRKTQSTAVKLANVASH